MASSAQIDQLRARIAQIEAGASVSDFSVSTSLEPAVDEVCDTGGLAYSCIFSGCVSPTTFDDGEPSGASPAHKASGHEPSGKERPKDVTAAYQRILRIVGTREQSTLKVREKLLRAEFSPEVTQEAIDKAVRVGVIDDRRYCDALVASALRSGKGLEGVRREAASLGVSLEELDSYQIYLEEGHEGQVMRALQFLEGHPVRSKNQRDGAFRKLLSRGFPVSVASEAAGKMYPYRP